MTDRYYFRMGISSFGLSKTRHYLEYLKKREPNDIFDWIWEVSIDN